MQTIYFVTGNANKLAEVQQTIPNVQQLNIDLPELQALEVEAVIEHKLRAARLQQPEGIIAVEDIGIYINSLNGFPGALIKWLLKALDNQGIADLVSKYVDHSAYVKCVVGIDTGSEIKYAIAKVDGQIVSPRGDNGFGWDKIFQPTGFNQTYAEMSLEQKNEISTRRSAWQQVFDILKS
jgi:inosine triphosphate pyrophosphatase